MITHLPAGQQRYDSFVIDDGSNFKIDPRIYTSPAIFEEEMSRIFESTWTYVGHTSEIEQPGDFKTAMIGRNSVVMSRGDDGKVHVFLNSCRHRGNAVCRQPRGSARTFRCHYHGWTYSRTGDLLAVTKPDGYPKDFVTRLGGLIQLKVAEYRGLIFASLNDDVPDIEAHLGDVRKYIDFWADLSPEPEFRVARPHLYDYQANWKFQAENGHDGWHARFVHESAFQTIADFGGTPSSQRSTAGVTRSFDRGFALLERAGLPQGITPGQQQEYRDALGRGRSPEEVETLWHVRQIYLFPNAFLFDNLIRVIEPVTVARTNVASYPLILRGVSDELNQTRFRELQSRLSTTGMVSEDDLEMFVANQTGMRNTKLRWIDLSHGLGQEVPVSGSEVVGEDSSELPQRAIYREWLHLLNRPVAK
jgi:phenylpropionate dioxygenase-like ring-hydroxylating dioxygenase large terminal subunit